MPTTEHAFKAESFISNYGATRGMLALTKARLAAVGTGSWEDAKVRVEYAAGIFTLIRK
jgi:squalene cyclase